MAQVAFIASGQATLVGGTLVVANPRITANSIALASPTNALGVAVTGVRLESVIDAGAHTVTFTSVDQAGNAVAGDVYTFNYVILEGGNIDSNITATINAERDFLINGANHGQNVLYVNNLKAMEAAKKAILTANAIVPAVVGAAMEPGSQKAPFPYNTILVNNEPLKLVEVDYKNEFFDSDAIGKNHNGTVNTNIPFNAAAPRANMNMTDFYSQIVFGKPNPGGAYVAGSVRDALSYYLYRDQGTGFMVPHLRYKMPVFHYRTQPGALNVAARYLPISYDSAVTTYPYFSAEGVLVPDPNGVNGPVANSFEAKSLQAAFIRLRKEIPGSKLKIINKLSNLVGAGFKGWKINNTNYASNAQNQAQVPMCILPNFLKGCVIRTELPRPNSLLRPLGNSELPGYADLWCKVYAQPDGKLGCKMPYDKSKIFLPDGYYMVESWTGMVHIIDDNGHYVDMPEGAVMMGGENALNFDTIEAQSWRDDFFPQIAVALGQIFTAGAGNENLSEMFPTANSPMYRNVDMLSCVLGLAMFVFNLRAIGREIDGRNPRISGGYIKKNTTKKNRNMNKRQRQRRSKSKSMSMLKSAKRTFYRMNKRNKTSRQYH